MSATRATPGKCKGDLYRSPLLRRLIAAGTILRAASSIVKLRDRGVRAVPRAGP